MSGSLVTLDYVKCVNYSNEKFNIPKYSTSKTFSVLYPISQIIHIKPLIKSRFLSNLYNLV